ncbi:hypothetical protein KC19_VG223300 [Ceratodon purpureus]|uniref:Uncharacterized protein n=1 Tax=Ceratodon purpureus TaxID=3225 RepID=A0A8T0HSE6_CERPU|nr:hypothetical protein KC19_VG223300 [Ceratodon purpureus]
MGSFSDMHHEMGIPSPPWLIGKLRKYQNFEGFRFIGVELLSVKVLRSSRTQAVEISRADYSVSFLGVYVFQRVCSFS